jgi:hypothetical protein
VKNWFAHPAGAGPVPPDDELPETPRRCTLADRACCCPARPVITVVMPASRGRPHPVDLLLCGHHYRASLAALHAVGASVYDNTGALIMTGEEQPPVVREPAAARTNLPYRAPVADRQD